MTDTPTPDAEWLSFAATINPATREGVLTISGLKYDVRNWRKESGIVRCEVREVPDPWHAAQMARLSSKVGA